MIHPLSPSKVQFSVLLEFQCFLRTGSVLAHYLPNYADLVLAHINKVVENLLSSNFVNWLTSRFRLDSELQSQEVAAVLEEQKIFFKSEFSFGYPYLEPCIFLTRLS
jgi:hypothetical protein